MHLKVLLIRMPSPAGAPPARTGEGDPNSLVSEFLVSEFLVSRTPAHVSVPEGGAGAGGVLPSST